MGKKMLSVLMAAVSLSMAVPTQVLAEEGMAETQQETTTESRTKESDRQVIRIGYPIQEGLTGVSESDGYYGYTTEYLHELEKYTEWKFELVQTEGDFLQQIATFRQMMEEDTLDMIASVNYREDLEAHYLFPSYNYATAYTALCVKADDNQWLADDYVNWSGIRVAVYPGIARKVAQLEKFAEVSGFTYELVQCKTYGETIQAVMDEKADAVMQADISVEEGLRGICRFSPNPIYFAVSKSHPELLGGLNNGMYSLYQSNPNLKSVLYDKYFSAEKTFFLSDEDVQWIREQEPKRVLFFDGNKPIQYGEGGKAYGIARSFFEMLKEDTGLEYEPVIASNYEEGKRLIEEGKVDLVAAVPADSTLPQETGLVLTYPYIESGAVMVRTTDENVEKEEPEYLTANTEAKLNEMAKNQSQDALLDSYCVNYYMRKKVVYDKLEVDWREAKSLAYSVGFAKGADSHLIAIINRYSKGLPGEAKRQMAYENTTKEITYTFKELLYIYKWVLLGGAFLIGIFVYAYLTYKKQREHEANKAESDRLYEFSKIVNECLFEYDYKKDRLILQNNQILFRDKHIVQPFMGRENLTANFSENEKKCAEGLLNMLRNKIGKAEVKLRIEDRDIWYKVRIAYMDDGYALGRVAEASSEVIERKELERKANIDALTGLLNRHAVTNLIDNYIAQGETEGAYLLFDLDNFKSVNDTLGHQKGDELLQEFSKVVQATFRESDLKARLGGDEFVVFIPNRIEENRLSKKLEGFIAYAKRKVFSNYGQCNVSVSVGAAFLTEMLASSDDLYREADSAMYVAKYGGKNDFFISDGIACMRRKCINCRSSCKKKEYLAGKCVEMPIEAGYEEVTGEKNIEKG